MSTETYHAVNCMSVVHTKNSQHVQCVLQCLEMIRLKNTQMEGACVTRDIDYIISREFVYTGNTKLAFSFTRVRISGTHHCGKACREAFNIRG